jgi:outer membrane lipoprotein-sorting protein
MKSAENIERLIKEFCAGKKAQIKTTTELDERIIADALPAQNRSKTTQSAAVQPNVWRIVMRSRIIQYTAAAMILLVIITGIIQLGKPIGPSVAFAAAMDSIEQARTFSCTEIFEATYEDDGQRGKYLMKQRWMFKEPDRERHETLTSPWPQYIGEVTIMDYGIRQRLELRPVEKAAVLRDMISDYEIDDKTGELRLTQLDTSLRDRLLRLSVGAVEDFGSVELEGQPIRMLQSHRDNRITTVWVDPETDFPVQIEIKWTDRSQSPVLYTSIQIDTELDDDLFSLEPPEGYAVSVLDPGWPDEQKKMLAKIRYLSVMCYVYADKHNDQFPSELADLVTAGVITDEALKKALASPDEPDGPPVILYRQPDMDVEDWSIEVMLYEVFGKRSGDSRVVVGMLDSHVEFTPIQTFVQLLKPWPGPQKKLSVKMTRLHWFCDRYAKEHEGQYPGKLADLAGADLLDETIKSLQAPWGQSGGAAVIRYRPPLANADPATEVVFYEIHDQWPDDGAVVCYADGHCEVIADQNHFEELIR